MAATGRARAPGRIVEIGTYGLARYARMSSGETIWWGSEEDVPDQVALAAGRSGAGPGRAEAGRAGSDAAA
ncbi:hypothetical protein M446_2041 [Methylobacterium sp. 4-46]|uniref:hypothetical protein n=1 Tax=unclassified Methylobacterium TaxID=2615210 RepID=UPI000165C6E7|nr:MULTISPECIES: hypothetical protein [Methylobacterium]ACA16505.1 hypothetical protein M446_2041 [Methylobacterium sp. 4-46]WFT82214.1 hypothetical protein QA634_10345 [Methylobacterium nodulans]